jgi:hypothetical protein
MITIVELLQGWLKTLAPYGIHVVIDAAAIATKVLIDLKFDGDVELDETTRLEVQAKFNQALLAAKVLEVV